MTSGRCRDRVHLMLLARNFFEKPTLLSRDAVAVALYCLLLLPHIAHKLQRRE